MARNPHFYPSFGKALYVEMLFNWSVTALEDFSRWQVEGIKTTMARTIEVDNVNVALSSTHPPFALVVIIFLHYALFFFLSFIFISCIPDKQHLFLFPLYIIATFTYLSIQISPNGTIMNYIMQTFLARCMLPRERAKHEAIPTWPERVEK